METGSLRLPGGECAGRSPWVLPGASQFPGCVELYQQEGQEDQLVTGNEIHTGGGLIVMEDVQMRKAGGKREADPLGISWMERKLNLRNQLVGFSLPTG